MTLRTSRRAVLGGAAATPVMAGGDARAAVPGITDIHAHVFNATDLPAENFLRIVFLHREEEQGEDRFIDTERGDIVDWLVHLFVSFVASGAPSARDEIEVLRRRAPPRNESVTRSVSERVTREAVASFLLGEEGREVVPQYLTEEGRAELSSAIQQAAGRNLSDRSVLTRSEARSLASRALRSLSDVGRYLRWFALFTRYRFALVDELSRCHARQGHRAALLCPALVDYSRWLDEEVDSSLGDQVAVMGLVSARPNGPAVHGWAPFDPLREAYARAGLDQTEPIEVVRLALTEHGFLGVKLYPPMGYRPWGNVSGPAQLYPQRVIDALDPHERGIDAAEQDRGVVSQALNLALIRLYDLCVELDAPILAHASESNGAAATYAERADPAFWIAVLERWPTLRLCLGHFGSFSATSHGAELLPAPENSWEWAIGRAMRSHPSRKLYVDLSYFSEALKSRPERAETARLMRRWMASFDPDAERLVFGSDWIMLARERGFDRYDSAVARFLRDQCGLDRERLDRVMRTNALQFAGLREGEGARDRLLAFYRARGLSPSRLPSV